MANKKDLFAPPSQEELNALSPKEEEKDIFAPPTQAELSATQPDIDFSQQPTLASDAGDLASGVIQGATLGGSDEIGGALDAGLIKVTDAIQGKKGKEFLKLYRENQQRREKANLAAKERSPWLYGSGELGGAIGTGVLTSGLGSGVAAGKGALTAAEVGKLALTGASLGGTQGALSSQGNIDSQEGLEKLVKDATTSAAIGGVLAPAAGMASRYVGGKVGQKAAEVLADDPEAQKIKLAYEAGKKGLPIKGESGRTFIRKDLTQATEDASKKLMNLRTNASQDIGDVVNSLEDVATGPVIENAEQRATQILQPDAIPALAADKEFQGFTKLINEYKGSLGNKIQKVGTEAASEVLDNAGNPIQAGKAVTEAVSPELSGQNLQQLALKLKKLQRTTKDVNVKGLISQTLGDIENTFNAAGGEELAGLNQTMKTLSQKGPETFLKKEVFRYPTPEKALDAIKLNIKNAVLRSTRSGSTDSRELAFETMNTLKNNLNSIKAEYPEVLRSAGIDNVDSFVDNLLQKGKMADIYANITRLEPHTGLETTLSKLPTSPLKLLGFGAESARGKGYLGAYRAGKMVNIGQKLYGAGESTLLKITDKLHGVGLKHLATALERGIQDPSGSLKNAALFSILQNPKAREALQSELNTEEGFNEQQ